ncbi:hypothetical protein IAQ61_004307 [Plenodomus lingam]|uniref:uncharacterized protein n=1 Tax=Leptosphaeria maculans TaxID=5022 RepID=UPI003318498F|nr:hypothetical protein IAQ61_004307 [Plenodomus lingam]
MVNAVRERENPPIDPGLLRFLITPNCNGSLFAHGAGTAAAAAAIASSSLSTPPTNKHPADQEPSHQTQ